MAPTLVFVPGAWHPAEVWSKVTALLDYKCICPTLPTTHGPGTFKDDIDAVRDAIVSVENEVVVVVHSYGSLPGSSAIKGLTGSSDIKGLAGSRVIGYIAIATGFPITGMAFLDTTGGEPLPFFKFENGYTTLTVDAREHFYHDLPEDEGKDWVSKLGKQSKDAFFGGEHAYAGWKEVPAWYIATTEDKAFPIEAQRMYLAQSQAEGNITVREIASSHSPMLSRPQETADLIKEAVRSFTG